jgi:TrmH family RNA methyltransferase
MIQPRAQDRRRPSPVFGRAHHDDHVRSIGFVAYRLLLNSQRQRNEVPEHKSQRQDQHQPKNSSHLRYSVNIVMESITSPANPLLKDVRKALTRGGLTASGQCVAETLHLLDAALGSDCRVRTVIAGESIEAAVERRLVGRTGIRVVVVPDKLLDVSSQGVVALVDPPELELRTPADDALLLVIDGVQDPGNLGTILRSAEAFGATGLLTAKGTVWTFNPKVLRASAGSIFRVPCVQGLNEVQMTAVLRESGADIYAAVPNGTKSLTDVDLTRPCAIVIGSEGHGVSAAMRNIATDLSIPTTGVESLNAAVSAAVLLYEARRQRTRT